MAEVKTEITLQALSGELKNGRIRPIYVLTGSEKYLIEQVKEKLTETIVNAASKDFDLAVFDNWKQSDSIMAALETPPLFSEKKLVFVKQSDLFANAPQEAAPDLSRLPDGSCLVLVEEKVLKSGQAKKHRAALEHAGGAIVALEKQSTADLQTWIARQTGAKSLRITRQAANQVIEREEHDMGAIAAAVSRLMLYAQHEGQTDIDEGMVDHLLPAPLSVRIFDLMDAISQKQAPRAFLIIDELMDQREAVAKISFMVLRQIRHLMAAKDLGGAETIREVLSVQPFVARKLQNQSQRFSEAELYRIHSRGFDFDVDIRRGKIDDKTALFLLVAYACEAA